ncbi:prepilin-type N-terminal cleavage/methylation domain-containing protein [Kurthia gibsonii]|uniref:prepilin-type N-terminal cleavage/methylation domain-containing protein n=1 Tax=Kurthia gibsonii TaxID=33946 RepID=UPI001F0BCA4C|nr:prepilin-type N-terminal cleavage/methylation domain-containing protein [Kurthia gibsonii]
MRNLLNKKLKNEKGLTLIELLAVIVILAIIALIAIPAIGSIVSNSKSKAILSDSTAIIAGAKTAITDGACDGVATTGATACTKANLGDYLEDAKGAMSTSDVVVKDGNTYKITYAKFGDLNDKYAKLVNDAGATNVKTSKVATQPQIAAAMGGK